MVPPQSASRNRLATFPGLADTRQFVLGLWKFLHISKLQQEHGIPASVVEELTPLPLVTRGREPSMVEEIEALAKQEAGDDPSHLPLPMCHAYYHLSPDLRRTTYDYVVAVGGRTVGEEKGEDSDLYRDDEKLLKAKLKAQELGEGQGEEGGSKEKSQLELLKEQRDYKRRRQTYRAKNVHITRRTPAQVLGAIISGRMEEIRAAVLQQQQQLSGAQPEQQADQQQSQLDSRGDRDEISTVKPTDSPQHDQRSGVSSPHHKWDRGRSKETPSEHGYRSRRERSRSRSSSKCEKQKHSSSERVKSSEQQDRNKRDDSRERRKHKRSRKHSRSRSRDRHKKRKSRSRSRSRDRHRSRKSRSRSRDRHRSRSKSRSQSKPTREKHKHNT